MCFDYEILGKTNQKNKFVLDEEDLEQVEAAYGDFNKLGISNKGFTKKT